MVCFRCGQATADVAAARPAAGAAPGWPVWVAAVGLVALVIAGLFMARAAAGQLPAPVSYTVAGLAAIVLAWRIIRRRRT